MIGKSLLVVCSMIMGCGQTVLSMNREIPFSAIGYRLLNHINAFDSGPSKSWKDDGIQGKYSSDSSTKELAVQKWQERSFDVESISFLRKSKMAF